MKVIQLTSLLICLSYALSNPLQVCEDTKGKFPIPEIGNKLRNCGFVKKNIHLCIDSWRARNECVETCGGCQEDTEICLDARGKFTIPELEDEQRNCQYVREQNIKLCALSWTVRNRCARTCGKCGDNPPPELDEDEMVCLDKRGKFSIPQLDGEERNCQYVRNENIGLCAKSWKVRNRCPRTCGECGPNAGNIAEDEGLCTDIRGKFKIKELDDEWKNCQYVRRKHTELCDSSWRVKKRCQKTCGVCE